MGIQNPQLTARRQFENSTQTTKKLTQHIIDQHLDIATLDFEHVAQAKADCVKEKKKFSEEAKTLLEKIMDESVRKTVKWAMQ